jgi:hypothetical protein
MVIKNMKVPAHRHFASSAAACCSIRTVYQHICSIRTVYQQKRLPAWLPTAPACESLGLRLRHASPQACLAVRRGSLKPLSKGCLLSHSTTRLKMVVGLSIDLFAVVYVVLPKGVRRFSVVLNRESPLRLSALMHLARLQPWVWACRSCQFRELYLNSATADEIVQDAGVFLCGLSGIGCVGIVGLSSEHANVLNAALIKLQRCRLSYPQHLTARSR